MKRLDLNEINRRITEKHGDTVTLDEGTYINTHTKARFIDKDYGIFWNLVQAVYLGQGHPDKKLAKMQATCMKRYGVKNPTQSKEILKRREINNLDKHGMRNTIMLPAVQEQIRQTNLKNLGVENPFASKVIQRQIKQTHLETLGFEYATQAPEVKAKTRQTNMERYDVSCPLQDPEIHAKAVVTLMKDLGVDNAMKSPEVQAKYRTTMFETFGVEYPYQSPELMERRRLTTQEHFGVDFPAQNLEIARKAAKNLNKSIKKIHWKTGQEIVCVASYEAAVVDCWNTNRIDFKWQERILEMPDGRYYIPDAYLPGLDKWVEIKGFFRKDAKEKWEWFHKEHPNSELWDTVKLKEMGIL